MNLKCIIVDDEPLACELLKTYALQTPFLDVKGIYNSAVDAMTAVDMNTIDLIFLDINMPKISGLEFSKTLPSTTKVIFTTAYDEYAIEGFKVNAIDYLLKPISYSDFLQAANRALEWHRMVNSSKSDSIFVKSGYRIEKLAFENILYIENQKDYVKFYVDNQPEPISSLMNMQHLADTLPDNIFMRVHRSFIVNLNKVQTVERNCIVFGKAYIPVSETYRDKFNAFVERRIL